LICYRLETLFDREDLSRKIPDFDTLDEHVEKFVIFLDALIEAIIS
jgi:hypothetical protein